MAPATIIGSLAAFLCLISYIPQIVKGFTTKRLDDVSTLFMCFLIIGLILWVTYGSLRNDVVIIASNLIAVFLVSTVVLMKYYYIHKRNHFKSENLLNP